MCLRRFRSERKDIKTYLYCVYSDKYFFEKKHMTDLQLFGFSERLGFAYNQKQILNDIISVG